MRLTILAAAFLAMGCGGMVEPAPAEVPGCLVDENLVSCADADFYVFDSADVGGQCRAVGCAVRTRCAVQTASGFAYGVCR